MAPVVAGRAAAVPVVLAAQVVQRLARPGGDTVAEVDSVGGLIDLATRKLVEQPAGHYLAISRTPSVLGL